MKKKSLFLFVAVAIPSLIGCGDKPTPKVVTHKATATCNSGCYLGEDHKKKTGDGEVEHETGFSFKVGVEENFVLNTEDIKVTVNDSLLTSSSYTYTNNTFSLNSKAVIGDIKMEFNAKPVGKEKHNIYAGSVNCTMKYNDEWVTTLTVPDVEVGTSVSIETKTDTECTLTKDDIHVYIGEAEYPDSFTFDNNIFVLKGEHFVNDTYVFFDAKKPTPPEPPTTCYINFLMNDTTKTEGMFPETVESGSSFYGTFKANDRYRLPQLKHKSDEFKVRMKDREDDLIALDEYTYRKDTWEYAYWVDDNSLGHLYIPSGVIENEIDIIGSSIKQLMVTFKPSSKDGTDLGHWDDGTPAENPKIGFIDDEESLDDAIKNAGAYATSDRYDQGYRLKGWKNEWGELIHGATPLYDDTEAYAFYEVFDVALYITNFKNIDLDKTTLKHESLRKYKTEIKGELVAKDSFYLPTQIEVYRKEGSEFKLLDPSKYSYTPYSNKDNLVIPAEEVTGDIKISGECIGSVAVTFNPGEGTWDGQSSKDPKIGYIKIGDTLRDAMANAGIEEDKLPVGPNQEKFEGWYVQDKPVHLDDSINQNLEVKAKYLTESSFENDSWQNIINEANKGLDSMKTHYNVLTFIGRERTITLTKGSEQIDYKVRVIGENHDLLTEQPQGQTDKTAALTFEFTSIVDSQVQYGTNPTWKEHHQNRYSDSNLRKTLNGDVLSSFPSELQAANAVKQVVKQTLNGGDDESTGATIDKYNDRVFALSGKEIGLFRDKVIEESESESFYAKDYDYKEGEIYSYYSIYSTYADRTKIYHGKAHDYWLRSPEAIVEDQQGKAKISGSRTYFIKGEGGSTAWTYTPGRYNSKDAEMGVIGIAPAFCI